MFGFSRGGMMTYQLLSKVDWIKSAIILVTRIGKDERLCGCLSTADHQNRALIRRLVPLNAVRPCTMRWLSISL